MRKRLLPFLLLIAPLIAGPHLLASDYPVWEQRPISGFKTRDAGGTVVYDGEIYFFNGRDDAPGGGYDATGRLVQKYDPALDVLTNLATYPRAEGRYAFGIARVGDQVYVFGGTNVWGNYNTSTIDRYSITSNTWTLDIESMPRAGTTRAAAAHGKVYVFGTTAYNGPFTPNVLEFDPSTASIRELDSTVPGNQRAGLAVQLEGLIYLIGGADGNGLIATVLAYDPLTDEFYPRASLPEPGSGFVGGTYAGRIFVASGHYPGFSARVFEYSPALDHWSELLPMQVPRTHALGGVVDDSIVVIGGGGSSGRLADPSLEVGLLTPEVNEPPTADAGPDQAIHAGATVDLDGSASFDDNTPSSDLLYAWTFSFLPEGSEAVLDGADTPTPSFVADLPATYAVQLVVTDDGALESPPDEVVISAENLPPTADAGQDQLAVTGTTVYLDGSASSDPDSDPLEFAWSIDESPAGSTAVLTGADTATPTLVPVLEGLYRVGLVVSDFIGPGWPDTVEITATLAEDYAEIKIEASSEIIEDLAPGEVTTQGNQQALLNFLSQAILAIQEGDLERARHKLERSIERVDGCHHSGKPDGAGRGRDWITDCTKQLEVYWLLRDALEAVALLEP